MVGISNKVFDINTVTPSTTDDDTPKWKGMESNWCILYVIYCLDMKTKPRIQFVVLLIIRLIGLLGLLYLFVCSLDLMSSAFRLVGGKDLLDEN